MSSFDSDSFYCAVPCPKCGYHMTLEGTGHLGTENNWKCQNFFDGCDFLLPWNGDTPPAEYPSQGMAKKDNCTGKVTCKRCGSPTMKVRAGQRYYDNKYECEFCGSVHMLDDYANLTLVSTTAPTAANTTTQERTPMESNLKQHPTQVKYTCKRFYDTYEKVPGRGDVRVEAEENLQRYLNNNHIDPNRIVSVTTGAYASQYGGLVIITLVHY